MYIYVHKSRYTVHKKPRPSPFLEDLEMTLAELMKGSEEIIQRVDQQQHHERVRGSQWRRWQRELRVDQSLEHAGVYHKLPSLVKIVKAKD